MSAKLTWRQQEALKWLAEKADEYPQNAHGFNPTFRPALAAICRRALEPVGLVRINRISESHFRYSITPTGRAALKESA